MSGRAQRARRMFFASGASPAHLIVGRAERAKRAGVLLHGSRKLGSLLLGAILLGGLLSACQAARNTQTPLPFFPTYTSKPEHVATAVVLEPTGTAAMLPTNMAVTATKELPISPTAAAKPALSITFDPTQFAYATQEPGLLTDWRPPLYPTPWAPTPYDHFYFASPIAANEVNIPVQDYRYGGMFFQNVVHTGIDIPAPKYTPVLAAGSGTVIWAGYGVYREGYDPTDPYGLAVTVRHDFGYKNQVLYTIYGHLDQIDVAVGQYVKTGERLGRVGETGVVTGAHLHFEVRMGENSFFTTRNPELWLVPPIGWGIIVGRVMDTGEQLLHDQMFILTDVQSEENSFAWSYGKTSVNSDEFYQENLVAGELLAGVYLLRTAYAGVYFNSQIEVYPGMVSYFTFHGLDGFTIEPPPALGANFTPSPP